MLVTVHFCGDAWIAIEDENVHETMIMMSELTIQEENYQDR